MADTSFSWRLRLELEGDASLRMERPGRTFRFDPGRAPDDDAVLLLTWNETERLVGAREAVAAGRAPTVLADPALLSWLSEAGEVQGASPGPDDPVTVDGVEVRFYPYTPIPYAEGAELLYKVSSAVAGPGRALRRLLARQRQPSAAPVAVSLQLPDGGHFVHLNLALHRDTPDAWLDQALSRFAGSDWILAGVDYGHEDAFLEKIARFDARHILVADLVSDVRRALGLPTGVLTPLVDRLREQGLDAYVFATRASFRFEKAP